MKALEIGFNIPPLPWSHFTTIVHKSTYLLEISDITVQRLFGYIFNFYIRIGVFYPISQLE